MSMMCPPHSVKIVSTPSLFSALATRWPPEMTVESRVLRLRVSSAVVVDAVVVGARGAMTEAMYRSFCWDIERLQLLRIKTRRFVDWLDQAGADLRSGSPKWLRCEAVRLHRRLGRDVPAGRLDLCSPHRPQDEPGHQRSDRVHYASGDEDGVPIARHRGQHARQGDKQRSRALGGVEQACIRRGVLGAEGIGAGRGEQAVDLAPGEKDKPGKDDEQNGIAAVFVQRQDADRLQPK